ncbi:MAG: hypothetical protein ACYTF9_09745 [Planctomycetota bacterium]|jgi:hypothetical protein
MTKVTTATIGLFAMATLGLGGCNAINHHMTWHAPNDSDPVPPQYDEWDGFKMVYYPEQEVYYEPYTRTYAWMTDDGWMQSTNLPIHVRLFASQANIVTVPMSDPTIPVYTEAHADWPATETDMASAESN